MDVNTIIKLKRQGHSERSIAKLTGISRETVRKYCAQYRQQEKLIAEEQDSQKRAELQEAMVSPPKYNSENRKKWKLTPEYYDALKEILNREKEKEKTLGWNKQSLTRKQIHEQLVRQGFHVSYVSTTLAIKEIRGFGKECFIKQAYNLGDRLEYDFGEVKLIINGKVEHYYLAVLAAPASKFRWCYLYENSKKDVFLDSHVRFFNMIGGVWKEVVYDNMRNVVNKFIGKNEKELNEDLVKMSIYYGFDINVTNAFSGNEKGYVEGSVKLLRNKIFSENYRFPSKEAAIAFMNQRLTEINATSRIEQEKALLIPAKPPLELAEIRESIVDKCSLIRVENNFYSVPEYLVGYTVTVKLYRDKLAIYSNRTFVCSHERQKGSGHVSADIRHYLNTFDKKSAALKHSAVLKSNPELLLTYNKYYSKDPRKFVRIIRENRALSDEQINHILIEKATRPSIKNLIFGKRLDGLTKAQFTQYNSLIIGANQ